MEKEDLRKKEIVVHSLEERIKIYKVKLKTVSLFASIFSLIIICLSLLIIGLAIWAVIDLVFLIQKGDSKFNSLDLIMPIIVASFTLFLFVISSLQIIYGVKNKSSIYQENSDELQYLILKLRNAKEINEEEAIEIYNKMLEKENKESNLSYKEVFKEILGGKK